MLFRSYFSDADLYSDYVSYALVENGILISEGTVLFCQPKHFHFENPDLSFSVEGDEIVITSCCYAKSVEIRNENDDLICDNNFFDLNKETKRRDRNHPSVILWSVANEEWGIEWDEKGERIAATMRDYCHRFDPTRPMTAATSSGPNILVPVDVAGYN